MTYAIHTIGTLRSILGLTEAQRALRALRPSFRTITLPARFVTAPEVSVHMAGPLRMPLIMEREVPVFLRQRRRLEVRAH